MVTFLYSFFRVERSKGRIRRRGREHEQKYDVMSTDNLCVSFVVKNRLKHVFHADQSVENTFVKTEGVKHPRNIR